MPQVKIFTKFVEENVNVPICPPSYVAYHPHFDQHCTTQIAQDTCTFIYGSVATWSQTYRARCPNLKLDNYQNWSDYRSDPMSIVKLNHLRM